MVDTIRVDLDWLRGYAAVLDRGAGDASAALGVLRESRLEDEAFGEIGRSLRTPQSYRRAADSLLAQLARAEEVLTAAAAALREAAEHYQSTDFDGARTLERRSGGGDATG